MAKSIRSKSKRRVRAIKRERLAPRVLKRLQATVSNLGCNKIKMEIDNPDLAADSNVQFEKVSYASAQSYGEEEMDDRMTRMIIFSFSALIGVKSEKKCFLKFQMETDNGNFNLKTMKKPDGSYPVWLSQRKIKRKKREQKIKQNAKRRKARKIR
uniref:Uncharacterized protein n=1 Tax=Elaeophora elaphi TaxID=1147741 RepID=A0A0R3RVV4_9BILA